jgi:hypothetical protein
LRPLRLLHSVGFLFIAKPAKNPQSAPRGNYTLHVLCESHYVLCVYYIPLDLSLSQSAPRIRRVRKEVFLNLCVLIASHCVLCVYYIPLDFFLSQSAPRIRRVRQEEAILSAFFAKVIASFAIVVFGFNAKRAKNL